MIIINDRRRLHASDQKVSVTIFSQFGVNLSVELSKSLDEMDTSLEMLNFLCLANGMNFTNWLTHFVPNAFTISLSVHPICSITVSTVIPPPPGFVIVVTVFDCGEMLHQHAPH